MKLKRLIASSVMAASLLVPGSAALAGSLISVGNIDAVDDVCTNVNINLGVELGKTQTC